MTQEEQDRLARLLERRVAVEKDLLDQLDRMDTDTAYYKDLISDYMALWDIKNELIKDIKDRGVTAKYQNGPNQWGYKKNESIAELNKTNAQMLKILQNLGIKPTAPGDDPNEEM